jgi:DNA-binding CsgD family transcriptional regulator
MRAYYPTLTSEIAKRGIKKNAIARQLGISERSLYNLLN